MQSIICDAQKKPQHSMTITYRYGNVVKSRRGERSRSHLVQQTYVGLAHKRGGIKG
jgi:hypothetical protein